MIGVTKKDSQLVQEDPCVSMCWMKRGCVKLQADLAGKLRLYIGLCIAVVFR